MKATGLHCRHGDLGQDFFSTSRLAFWAVIFRMLSPLITRRVRCGRDGRERRRRWWDRRLPHASDRPGPGW